ncbi:MAG TPA: hypothetical protein VKH43_05555 [Thermoanaerobaculia bacterium]|nr:hypothetical protein [Thermoanaerobaculia bacterium]
MKRMRIAPIALIALLAGAGAASAADTSPVASIATILSGTFQGSTPGNELRMDLRSIPTDAEHPYDLFLEVTGKYQGQSVRRQGLLRLETQGSGVYVGYIPHFDATVTALSDQATRFTESEANAACGISMNARGDGFAGETPAAGCAIALRGVLGKWTLEIEPGSVRVRETTSGETLRFKRVSK